MTSSDIYLDVIILNNSKFEIENPIWKFQEIYDVVLAFAIST